MKGYESDCQQIIIESVIVCGWIFLAVYAGSSYKMWKNTPGGLKQHAVRRGSYIYVLYRYADSFREHMRALIHVTI